MGLFRSPFLPHNEAIINCRHPSIIDSHDGALLRARGNHGAFWSFQTCHARGTLPETNPNTQCMIYLPTVYTMFMVNVGKDTITYPLKNRWLEDDLCPFWIAYFKSFLLVSGRAKDDEFTEQHTKPATIFINLWMQCHIK